MEVSPAGGAAPERAPITLTNLSSGLDHALRLADEGFWVHPIVTDKKAPPVFKDWPTRATRNKATIRKWYRNSSHLNVGIYTGRFGDDGALVVVDVDNKNGKNGDSQLVKLELDGFDLPDTREQTTPNGGRHLIYKTSRGVRGGNDALAPGVDIKSVGGYIVGAGSWVARRQYTMDETPIADAPQWLIDRCGQPRAKERSAARAPVAVDASLAEQCVKRAIDYLTKHAPLAIEGAAGDQTTFKVACQVKDQGVSEAVCYSLLSEHWNPRCQPPWTPEDLAVKVRNAYRYGVEPVGAAAPEADFESVPAAEIEPSPVAPWLEEMNRRYAVTMHHGAVMIHERAFDHELGIFKNAWLTRDAIQNRHEHELVRVADPNRSGRTFLVGKGRAWLVHRDRRQYEAEAFLPGQDAPAGVMNLWQGFNIAPAPGHWPLMRRHLQDVICNGDETGFKYLLGWLALMVQAPHEQGKVAVVLQGDEGTGKGTLGHALARIFGEHALHVVQARQLTGHFNEHLAGKCFIFADEAFFAGDPRERGPLYALITEPTINLEPKGVDARQSRNVLHVLMATNSDWAVPAGANARRFAVYRVSDAHRQDRKYFTALRNEMDRGGLAAMLHDLLAYDLSGFDVFAVPQNAALIQQKIHSLGGAKAWLFEALQAGRIGLWDWGVDGLSIEKTEAHGDYARRAATARGVRPAALSAFTREISSVLGAARYEDDRPRAGGKVGARRFRFASLVDCRAAFEKHIGGPVEWETD